MVLIEVPIAVELPPDVDRPAWGSELVDALGEHARQDMTLPPGNDEDLLTVRWDSDDRLLVRVVIEDAAAVGVVEGLDGPPTFEDAAKRVVSRALLDVGTTAETATIFGEQIIVLGD